MNTLSLHMQAEEKILYPAMRRFAEEKDLVILVIEAYEEHAEVKALLSQMNELDPATPELQHALAQVKTGIQHHVAEEEGEMFPDAQELLGKAQFEEIGDQIMEMKNHGDTSYALSVHSAQICYRI